ncbi:hypothetical protein GQ600_15337 [Phytophthora cactorum]|nr:hypothetical protein GQ600_15337 [Phytophthora cactorum]
MLRVAGGLVRSARASSFHSDILQRSSHVNTLTARGIKLRRRGSPAAAEIVLLSRASRHDRVLTASLGLVSGGIIVTSVINKQEENRDFKGVIGNLYGDANDLFYRQNGRQFDEPVRNFMTAKGY